MVGSPRGELLPGVAAVGGFEKTAAGAGPRAVFPGALARGPQHGVDGARVGGIEREVDRAGVFVFVEHLLPRVAAIGGAEDAALGVGAVGVTEDGREEAIGIARVDEERRDLLAAAQSEMAPGEACVGGFVDSVAHREIGALQAFAAGDINDVGVGRRDGECADGAGGLAVEERVPGAAGVGGFPDTAVVGADVENVGLRRYAGGGDGASAAERSDVAPAEAGVEVGRELLRGERRGEEQEKDRDSAHAVLLDRIPSV